MKSIDRIYTLREKYEAHNEFLDDEDKHFLKQNGLDLKVIALLEKYKIRVDLQVRL